MPKPRAWPTHAEDLRRDYIALALDIQHLTREVYAALSHGDAVEAARLNQAIYNKAMRQQQIMVQARREDT